VSVLWGLADDATRASVYAAHRAALDHALAFVEHKVIRTRVGEGGSRQITTRGMVAAAFDHWDTRAGDPNLHTHVVVANKVQGPDGVWRSVDGKTVHAATITVSELYDTLLADEVARRLPVRWSLRDRGPRRNPAFEIDGIGDDVLGHFSARSEQIHRAEQDWAAKFTADRGREPTKLETTRARQYLARVTRPPKPRSTDTGLERRVCSGGVTDAVPGREGAAGLPGFSTVDRWSIRLWRRGQVALVGRGKTAL
jgi:conjugative relaxase-like TrwC/TraI family protein